MPAAAKRARVEEEDEVDEVDEDDEVPEELDLDNLKTYSTPDILICGNCR